MNKMLIITSVLSLFACESKETHYRSPVKKPAQSEESSLIVRIPSPAAFKMVSGNPTDFLNTYLLRVTSDQKKCEEFQRYELKDYAGADTVEIPVDTSCSFSIRFAIGKEADGTGLQNGALAFDAFYTTEDSLDIEPSDFEKGEVEVKLHLKRTTLGQKLGFSSDWVKDDLGQGDADVPDSEIVDTDNKDDQIISNNTGSSVTYADLKSTIDAQCASCHRPGGSRSSSDLSTFNAFKNYASNAVGRISAGTMPTSGALSPDLVQKFKDWQKAGFPEKSGGSTTTNNSTSDQKIVEFRIKSGTGNGAWNTADTQLNLKVGQVLKLINDDAVRHRFHTNNSPCPHGNDIQPGKSEDCVISREYTGAPLYDHNTLGKFYIRAVK